MLRPLVMLLVLVALGCARQQPAAPSAPATPVIPGMESGILRVNLENRGLTCVGPQVFESWVTWECRGTKDAARYLVLMRGINPSRIFSVDATVIQNAPNDVVAAEFLGYVATIPYEGARAADARTWVQSELGKSESARKAFGGAMYELTGPPANRSLTISPTTVP